MCVSVSTLKEDTWLSPGTNNIFCRRENDKDTDG